MISRKCPWDGGYLSGLSVIARLNIREAREIALGGKFSDGRAGKWVGWRETTTTSIWEFCYYKNYQVNGNNE